MGSFVGEDDSVRRGVHGDEAEAGGQYRFHRYHR